MNVPVLNSQKRVVFSILARSGYAMPARKTHSGFSLMSPNATTLCQTVSAGASTTIRVSTAYSGASR